MSEQTEKSCKKRNLPLFIPLFFALLILNPTQIKAGETTVFYTVSLKRLHPDVLSSLILDAPLTDSVSKSPIGTVENVAVMPHMCENYSADKDCMVEAPHPFFRDVTLTVRAYCEVRQNGYKIGPFDLFKGMTLHFFTPSFTGIGECTAIYESGSAP